MESHPVTQTTMKSPGSLGLPWWFPGKEPAGQAGDASSIPELGRSPREGNGYPVQYYGLENPMNSIVHGVSKSCTQLSDFHFHSHHITKLLV